MERGLRWAVEARRKGRGAEEEERRQEEQGAECRPDLVNPQISTTSVEA